VAAELDGLRLLDFRLRSSAQPDASQIARYYQTVYEPAMHAKRARPAPLADVAPQIREILTQQKIDRLDCHLVADSACSGQHSDQHNSAGGSS